MIDYITLGNTEYPVKFGFNAISLYCEEVNILIGDITEVFGDKGSIRNLIKLAWYGLKDGARIEHKPFDMDVASVADLLDEAGKLKEINEIFLKQFTANFQTPAENAGT